MLRRLAPWSIVLVLGSTSVAAQQSRQEPVLAAMAAEVDRAMETLADDPPAPYFIAAELTETNSVRISGESGGLHGYSPVRRRWLDVDLRFGSRELDSSHPLRSGSDGPRRGGSWMPLSDDPALVRHAVWSEIDRRYHEARERWAKVEAESKVLVEEEPAEDLAPAEVVRATRPLAVLRYDAGRVERIVKAASRVLAENPTVLSGSVDFTGSAENRWFVSSEGTRIRHGSERYRLEITAETIAEDGDRLRLHFPFDMHDAARMPSEQEVVARARALAASLTALVAAPLQEPYAGPAILSDMAAGVFFHEIFGHRVEGHRLKQVDNAQTFRNRVGELILPRFLSVYDDPTLEDYVGADLNGFYLYDNQGVEAQRVVLVRDGVLEGFLQSRSPVERGQLSNGHGRRQPGSEPVSRQGTLIVEASTAVGDAELRRELIELARAQGLEYGLYIEEIQGGFTFTSRTTPNAFNINALQTYRVFIDGRPDELVRGVDLIGTPLEAFGKIVRAGELHRVFNGVCGAESGWVPVSSVSPALLLESIETQRKRKDQVTPPLLPAPLARPEAAVQGEPR